MKGMYDRIVVKNGEATASVARKHHAIEQPVQYFDSVVTTVFCAELEGMPVVLLKYVTKCLAAIGKTWGDVATEAALVDMAYDGYDQPYAESMIQQCITENERYIASCFGREFF